MMNTDDGRGLAVEAQLVSVYDGAKMLGISVWTLRSYAYKGLVESVKLGTRLMFEVRELERFIAENTRPRFMPKPVPRGEKRLAS